VHAIFDESQVFRSTTPSAKSRSTTSWPSGSPTACSNRNGLFEPVWNRQHISYVQIDVPEALLVISWCG